MTRLSTLVAIFIALPGCSHRTDPWTGTPEGQKRVLACFAPIYCFASNVAGEHAKVNCLLTSTGPHDFDPSPNDAIKVTGADVFLLNGLDLDEGFAMRLANMAGNKGLVRVELGEEIDHHLLEHVDETAHEHKEGDGHHHHGDHDPHIWLGLPQARAMVGVIAKKLSEMDPAHKDVFAKNAKAFDEKLAELETHGKKAFAAKKNRAFLSTHDSLRYFAKTFDLEYVDSIMPRPGDEADANKLARLVEVCKKKNVSVIAVEPQYARGPADTLARVLKKQGVELRVVEIDPMETATPGRDGNPSPTLYLEQMRRNIDNLAGALP